MRKDVENIVNKLALKSSLDFRMLECYNLILNYCKINKTQPKNNNYKLVNGCLYINNNIIKRVEPLPQKNKYSEEFYYLNGKLIK